MENNTGTARNAADNFLGSWPRHGFADYIRPALVQAFDTAIRAAEERALEKAAKVVEERSAELKARAVDAPRTAAAIRLLSQKEQEK